MSSSNTVKPHEGEPNPDWQDLLFDSLRKQAEVPAPQSVGPYQILKELGRGGMGVVYLAKQGDRRVALKMILADQAGQPGAARRFKAEMEAQRRLNHPHIVAIHDVGEDAGNPYLVMELLEGGKLTDELALGPLTCDGAAELVRGLARALDHAHGNGVIHRDVKPGNILFTKDGVAKLSDFGLAKLTEVRDGLTGSRMALGTLLYMAPEVARGESKRVTLAADVYGLGVVLYECLTGRPPFLGANEPETLDQVINRRPVPPAQARPSVPIDLDSVCLKCLEKDPKGRYASAGALAADLDRYLKGEPIVARPVSRHDVPTLRLASPEPRPRPSASFLCWLARLPLVLLGWLAAAVACLIAFVVLPAASAVMGWATALEPPGFLEQWMPRPESRPDLDLGTSQLPAGVAPMWLVGLVGFAAVFLFAQPLFDRRSGARRWLSMLTVAMLLSSVAWVLGCGVGRLGPPVPPPPPPPGNVLPERGDRPGATWTNDGWKVDGVPMTLCWCPPGKFQMGSPRAERGHQDDEAQADAELPVGFWAGMSEVTQGQYQALMGVNPSEHKGDPSLPVENVSRDDAMTFCERHTEQERAAGRLPRGLVCRLPTEAEWEYFARAGTTTRFGLRDREGRGVDTLAPGMANLRDSAIGKPVPVDRPGYPGNAWGLKHLHGNVWEFCLDWYHPVRSSGINPVPTVPSETHVARGGSFLEPEDRARSAVRGPAGSSSKAPHWGFRVVVASAVPGEPRPRRGARLVIEDFDFGPGVKRDNQSVPVVRGGDDEKFEIEVTVANKGDEISGAFQIGLESTWKGGGKWSTNWQGNFKVIPGLPPGKSVKEKLAFSFSSVPRGTTCTVHPYFVQDNVPNAIRDQFAQPDISRQTIVRRPVRID